MVGRESLAMEAPRPKSATTMMCAEKHRQKDRDLIIIIQQISFHMTFRLSDLLLCRVEIWQKVRDSFLKRADFVMATSCVKNFFDFILILGELICKN